jgi:hypothetical protein
MRVATIKIKGITPYSPSKAFTSEKKDKESPEAFDIRCWREHAHVDASGNIVIPSVSIGKALADTASFLSKGGELKKVGNAKWAENFFRGLAIAKSPQIGYKSADMKEPEMVYCHADGNRKSGKRVWRRFPIFHDWTATLVVHILDDSIPEDVFAKVVESCGLFNGFGRYSPRTGGHNGRFVVESLSIK